MKENGKISLVTYILLLIVIAVITTVLMFVVFKKKEDNKDSINSIVSHSETESELIENIEYIEISVEDEKNTEDRYVNSLKVEN